MSDEPFLVRRVSVDINQLDGHVVLLGSQSGERQRHLVVGHRLGCQRDDVCWHAVLDGLFVAIRQVLQNYVSDGDQRRPLVFRERVNVVVGRLLFWLSHSAAGRPLFSEKCGYTFSDHLVLALVQAKGVEDDSGVSLPYPSPDGRVSSF